MHVLVMQDGLVGRRKKLEELLKTPYKDPSSLWQRVHREIQRDGVTVFIVPQQIRSSMDIG